jgi:putative ABC transport system substrate-binding protein
LSPFTPADSAPWTRAFLRGLRDLGWLDSTNIAIDYRYADGQMDRLPRLVAELIDLKVQVIVTSVTNDSLAAKNATRDIPIVMVAPGDPVSTGIVGSLARPGGNVTGLSQMVPNLNGKRLALMRELAPAVASLGVISNPGDPISRLGLNEVRQAAAKLRVDIHCFEARNFDELRAALDHAVAGRVQGLVILPNPVFVTSLKEIADFALR